MTYGREKTEVKSKGFVMDKLQKIDDSDICIRTIELPKEVGQENIHTVLRVVLNQRGELITYHNSN